MEEKQAVTAKSLIQAIRKSKKLLQIYPSNNMIYRAAIDEVYALAKHYLDNYGDIVIKIGAEGLFIDSEVVCHDDKGADNLAKFLLEEGVRGITILKGVEKDELEDFLGTLSTDFNREDTSDDFLTVAWEKDFEHIKIVADELFFMEEQEETKGAHESVNPEVAGGNYLNVSGTGAAGEVPENGTENDRLMRAYSDGLMNEEVTSYSAAGLDAGERAFVTAELNKGLAERINKLSEILIWLLLHENYRDKYEKIVQYTEDLISYAISCGATDTVLTLVNRLKNIEVKIGVVDSNTIECVRKILLYCVSKKVIACIGNKLDDTKDITEEQLTEYAMYFGNDAVRPLLTLLESLQTIHARHIVNNVLIRIGPGNIDALVDGLSDHQWYVVRNVICVLRGIGNVVTAQNSFLKLTRHEHPRVRLEALKSLQNVSKESVLQVITNSFDDEDSVVRLAAVSIIGHIARDNPGAVSFIRNALMNKINEKGFAERDFAEKKAFYEALVYAGDHAVEDYMLAELKKKWVFGGKKHVEAKACAAHYLGLVGSREALPVLDALMKSSDPLLVEQATDAAQRIRA